MCASTEGSRCGQVTIVQAQSVDVGDSILETPFLSLSLSPSLFLTLARCLTVSVPLSHSRARSLCLTVSVQPYAHMQMSTWDT